MRRNKLEIVRCACYMPLQWLGFATEPGRSMAALDCPSDALLHAFFCCINQHVYSTENASKHL